jgi:hypothetical protein
MQLQLAEYPEAVAALPDTEAELAAFRAGWRAVRAQAKFLAALAGAVIDHDGTPAYPQSARLYREQFARAQLAVWELTALAVTLSPEARARVEAGIGMPLFTADGALSPWWRSLWLADPRIADAARVRRINDTRKV